MTVRVYYATHSTGSYAEGAVVMFDDDIPQERDLAWSGYFEQIRTPEWHDEPAQSQDRAR